MPITGRESPGWNPKSRKRTVLDKVNPTDSVTKIFQEPTPTTISTMSLLKKIIPAFLSDRYFNIQNRLLNLENSVRHLNTAIDTILVSPTYAASDDIGFNGQRQRKQIFTDIFQAIHLEAILETGTWLGNTTGYMRATSGQPVYSCELNPRFYALAKMRLAAFSEVYLELNDSRKFLQGRRESALATKPVFFYLDAHWNSDLPLGEEMDLIGSCWKQFVILIDDFQVPDDAGYYFDDYGPGKALKLELLAPAIKKYDLAVFFPTAKSSAETGGKCGCVVLAPRGEISQKLGRLSSLRAWPTH